ncbi:MAG: hypothetical protein U5L00_13950 [Desulfovermiculus sp.]|nr:hypothetical protein [Desulfovermiculus sp.]
MDLDRAVERIREAVVGELKEEFKEFRAAVTGELAGYRVAIESLTARQTGMESGLRDICHSIEQTNKRIDETNNRIDETNKRIDQTRSELTSRIDETRSELKELIAKNTERIDEYNRRIDETNKRIDGIMMDVSEIKGELNRALSEKVVVDDLVQRVSRLEARTV